MNTIAITLYQDCNIIKSRNCKVDDIDIYLDSLTKAYYPDVQTNASYIDNSFSVVLTSNYYNIINKSYNYCKINYGLYSMYYFVVGQKQAGLNQIRVYLEIDSINSLWSILQLNDKTHITRQHKDRFYLKTITTGTNQLYRKVDREPEQFNPVLFKKSSSQVIKWPSLDWYLIYKTEKALSTTDLSNPLHCFLCASSSFTLKRSGITQGTFDSLDFSQNKIYMLEYIPGVNDGQFNFNGQGFDLDNNTFKYVLIYVQSNLIVGKVYNSNWGLYNTFTGNSFTFTGTLLEVYSADADTSHPEYYSEQQYFDLIKQAGDMWDSGLSSNPEIKSISSIDKTDSTIMKIIALPYCPTSITYNALDDTYTFNDKWIYNPAMSMLELNDLDEKLTSNILTNDNVNEMLVSLVYAPSQTPTIARNINYESKLYNSSYYQRKYTYDSFSKIIQLENFESLLAIPTMNLDFIVSNQMNSRFLFKFTLTNYNYYNEGDYPQYCYIGRNNEIALYNNDYLNYMRVGYNYDVKNKNVQLASGALSAGASLVGTLASASAGATGVGLFVFGSLLATSTSIVANAMRADDALLYKQRQLQAQSGSISANDDFNLMKEYTNNRLSLNIYSVSDRTKEALYDYFFLFGYAEDKYEVPNFNSRYWFNFVQFTPSFEARTGAPEEIYISQAMIEDFIERCQAGITIYHNHNNVWNFNQNYENWEAWIIQ